MNVHTIAVFAGDEQKSVISGSSIGVSDIQYVLKFFNIVIIVSRKYSIAIVATVKPHL